MSSCLITQLYFIFVTDIYPFILICPFAQASAGMYVFTYAVVLVIN